MTRRTFFGVVAVAFVAVTCAEITMPQGYARDGDLRIRLTGAGGSGSARARNRDDYREIEVEAESLKLVAGTILKVTIDGKDVGVMTLRGQRSARFELRSDRGKLVPAIGAGSKIAVVDQKGNVLMAGTF